MRESHDRTAAVRPIIIFSSHTHTHTHTHTHHLFYIAPVHKTIWVSGMDVIIFLFSDYKLTAEREKEA